MIPWQKAYCVIAMQSMHSYACRHTGYSICMCASVVHTLTLEILCMCVVAMDLFHSWLKQWTVCNPCAVSVLTSQMRPLWSVFGTKHWDWCMVYMCTLPMLASLLYVHPCTTQGHLPKEWEWSRSVIRDVLHLAYKWVCTYICTSLSLSKLTQ